MATAVFMVLLTKERSEHQIILAGRKDSLTGIDNRGALLDSGERLLRRCQTSGKSLSLIMFDLDHFKWVNDTFGHAAGDKVTATPEAIIHAADEGLYQAKALGRNRVEHAANAVEIRHVDNLIRVA